MSRGGKREGSGRKSKADEVQLIEKLGPLENKAFKALEAGIESGDFKYVQLFYHYFAGKPRETKDINLASEQPLFKLDE
jgi:hypothetical protein|tara:strand:- start:1454 stop:1690 length:237 start_codon:yes stop_codon:yes gene_type:complete